MRDRHPKRVEDYTNANLVLIFVNLLWIFGLLWSTWGLVPVLVTGLVLNHAINRIEVIRLERAQAHAPRATRDAKSQPTDNV